MNQIIEQKKAEIIELCKMFKIKRMYVFGSVLSNKFNDSSDIDFLISFIKNISIKEYTNNYFAIHNKLEELLNRKIDLVTECTLSNPYFIESINESKEVLFES